METLSSPSAAWGVFERLKPEQFAEFQQAGIGAWHAQLLFNRGIKTPDAMQAFLNANLEQIPDPRDLIDMERALPRVQQALDAGEHITIYGDFDADGVTSAALLTRALLHLGQPAEKLSFYLPSRVLNERGLNRDAINKIKGWGTSLIITTDCGSSDIEEVACARELGMDVIITDHHHPPAQLPQATAILNPWRPDCKYGERYLCGVGIAFKLAQALYQAYGRAQEVWELLDLVAIGTVGDVAILLGENHTLVRHGMQRLNTTKNPGLQALIEVSRLEPGRISARDISFVLAPRLNAAGRMAHADLAFRLLTTSDQTEANQLATKLEELNRSRQEQTEQLMKLVRAQAQLQADKAVILVSGEKGQWPEGIIGLVAGKLSEETKRPVFVLSQGTESSRGSARSPEHFNLILALQAARPGLFERYGGHAQAAGFTIANAQRDELHEHLLRCYEQEQSAHNSPGKATDEETTGVFIEPETVPTSVSRMVDLVLTNPEKQLTPHNLTKINQLSPFGAGNPEPVFRLDSLQLLKCWTTGADGRHLCVRLRGTNTRKTFEGILLRGGERMATLPENIQVQVIFSMEQGWGRSRDEIRLRILEILPLNS